MSKYSKFLYGGLIIIFLGLFGRMLFANDRSPKQGLQERKGAISLSAEWLNTRQAIKGLEDEMRLHPTDLTVKLNLAQGYIQEARITGNHTHYDKAALELLNGILEKQPDHFDALCCKATVLLSQHHFSEALAEANKAVKIQPHTAFVYGLLCDAYVELGNYTEAVKMADKMVSIRPDMRSYARVSYLREIHGDAQGAIEAMKLAVAAGYPGLEQSAWTRVTLGQLYENAGDLHNAEQQYYITLSERPDYPYALAGLARVEKARGNYKQAIKHLEDARAELKDFSFSEELIGLYMLTGNKQKAYASTEETIALLGSSEEDESEEGHGHYSDRELAYAHIKGYNYTEALQHALTEYERRPGNIDVCETVAGVRYKRGDVKEANEMIDKALKTNSQNALLLARAGLIKIKAGDKSKGLALLKRSMEINPFMDIFLRIEIQQHLNNVNENNNA